MVQAVKDISLNDYQLRLWLEQCRYCRFWSQLSGCHWEDTVFPYPVEGCEVKEMSAARV